MYLKMLDMDKFVYVNNLKEVTDSNYIQFGRPTPDGLFSYDIFGITQYDRSTIWAYVDLGTKFLHPLAAINFRRYGSYFDHIIHGTKYYRFENGEFIEDAENGDTGIDFLYDCYDKIKWKDTDSITSNDRIKFLKQGKEKIFLTKFPVCPPFYRDINENKVTGIPVVNELYKKLISLSAALKKKGNFTFFGNITKARIQDTLIEVFNHYTGLLKGKFGMMRRNVMSRNIDYGTWGVLSSPVINCERYSDAQVDFLHMGVPLPMTLALFKPFILQATKDYFTNLFSRTGRFTVVRTDGTKVTVDLTDPEGEYSSDFIDKQITKFVNDFGSRFDPVKLPENKQGEKGYITYRGYFGTSKELTERPLTWTDVFYSVAEEVTVNKSVMWSRYPIENMYSMEYPKVRVLSTINTCYAKIGEKEYKWYPVVKVGQDSSLDFVNTLVPNNTNILALGADYDGDSTPLRGIFTEEANLDCDRWRMSKLNILDQRGQLIRKTEKDFVQILYSLTKPTIYKDLADPN